MRRVLSSLAIAAVLTGQQAHAQLQCLGPTDRSAIEVAALRTQLMVLATRCQQDNSCHAFIRKYQSDLQDNETSVGDLFKRKYGKRGQQEHDRFNTELANGESSGATHLGTDFCERNSQIFAEVMSLRGPSELRSYAAGKDLVPSTLHMCTEVAQVPTARKQKTRR